MIDEEATFRKYGYTSDKWAPRSHKNVVAVYDECSTPRDVEIGAYRDFCHSCALAKANRKRAAPPDYMVRSIDDVKTFKRFGHHAYDLSPNSSGLVQGMSYDDWDGYAAEQKYCYKFNEDCRERNRLKYGKRCFVCGEPQSENVTIAGNDRKLSVHHYDLNKMQGCNDHEWKLVPLCTGFHTSSHNKIWLTRIEYLIEHVWYPGGVWAPDALC